MDFQSFRSVWNRIAATNAVLLVSNAILVAGFVAYTSMTAAKRERITLVPPNLTESAVVAWNHASAEYFKAWGLYVATLIGNITPDSARFIVDRLGSLFSAKLYPSVRTKLLSVIDDPMFGKSGTLNYFEPRTVQYEPATKTVYVVGSLVLVSYKGIHEPQRQNVVYEMQFEMIDGVPMIVAFDSYEDDQAHTQRWKRMHKREAEQFEKQRAKDKPAGGST